MLGRAMLLAATNSAAARALTPVDVGAGLWLDSYDTTTITEVSGAASQINDKSGNGRNATQATAASRPAVTTANGKQVLRFDGTNDFLRIAAPDLFPSGSQAQVSLIVVAVTNVSATSGFGAIISQQNANSYAGCALGLTSGRRFYLLPPEVAIQSAPEVLTGLHVVSWVIAAGATGQIAAYIDGTQVVSGSYSQTVSNGSEVQIGRLHPAFGDHAAFDLHQIAAIGGTSSSTIREQLEGWAAWTAGLQGDLPANHPYKAAAPTV